MIVCFCFILIKIDKIPTRFNVAMMLFMACFVAYMVRVNISVNILAMVVPDNKTGEAEEPPDVRQYNLFFFFLIQK